MQNKLKYFIISDVHSFYEEMIAALITAGYNKDNPKHVLIINGDIFDRGPDSVKIYEFLNSIYKDNLILIKGNHEQLFLDLLQKDIPSIYDFRNGTVDAFFQFAKATEEEYKIKDSLEFHVYSYVARRIDTNFEELWKDIVKRVKASGIVKWLKSAIWLDYYELDNLIITHSFIPLRKKEDVTKIIELRTYLTYFPTWRIDATEQEWVSAKWESPWQLYKDGFFKKEEKNGKTLVCGHWHTSDFYKYLGREKNSTRTDIYFSKGIIALDGGIRKKNGEIIYDCNVLVYEDKKFYDKYGNELKLKEDKNEN